MAPAYGEKETAARGNSLFASPAITAAPLWATEEALVCTSMFKDSLCIVTSKLPVKQPGQSGRVLPLL
jgi:hypothetical protein